MPCYIGTGMKLPRCDKNNGQPRQTSRFECGCGTTEALCALTISHFHTMCLSTDCGVRKYASKAKGGVTSEALAAETPFNRQVCSPMSATRPPMGAKENCMGAEWQHNPPCTKGRFVHKCVEASGSVGRLLSAIPLATPRTGNKALESRGPFLSSSSA